MILISACLFGLPCRYDGGAQERPERLAALAAGPLLPVCPEQLGGLPTPRLPAALAGGDGAAVLRGAARVVRTADGADVTAAFVRGARRCAELARRCAVQRAILRARSPSCGARAHQTTAGLAAGPGVLAAALQAAGVECEEWD